MRPEGVVFLGPVSSGQLRVLFSQAEALVFASLYEGFGLPPLESMTMGTPVIAMPISAMPEVGGDAVLYADGLSAMASARRAMERLASDENLREDLREKGYARAQNFLWEKTARETAAAYRAALRPSERSLRMRRLLKDVIIDWSQKTARRSGHGVGQVPRHSRGLPSARSGTFDPGAASFGGFARPPDDGCKCKTARNSLNQPGLPSSPGSL